MKKIDPAYYDAKKTVFERNKKYFEDKWGIKWEAHKYRWQCSAPLEISGVRDDSLCYHCNICGNSCETKMARLLREEPTCPSCGSTVRMRSIIHILSTELFGRSLALPDFPYRPDITGIGMSDWDGYAVGLARKLGYRNTFYHQEPKLDITAIDPALAGKMDFVISTDVFEHIEPPVDRAFENTHKLLKPGGVLVFSVPYSNEADAKEHFPDLYKYEIIKKDNKYILKNITKDGVEQVFEDPVLGGDGATLEMRRFSEASLKEHFKKAGFSDIRLYKEPNFEFGIYWHVSQWPMAVRK